MAGAGLSPFGTGPFGLPSITALAEERGQIPASRLINAQGRPVQVADDTGAFKGMPNVIQRAYILIAYGVPRGGKIGASYATDIRNRITTALAPLTSPKDPLVSIESVDITDSGGSTYWVVRLKDLKDDGKIYVLEPKAS
jgi:hypothetical protein